MSQAMNRIRSDVQAQYGPAPATPVDALAHVVKVFAGQPDDLLVVQATSGIYGDGVRTGLTLGDLRALAARLPA
jgi:hypothetical protein